MTVGEMIDQLLLMTGARTKAELAEMLDITPSGLNNWILRDNLPLSGVQRIREVVPNINPQWLMRRSDTMTVAQAEKPATRSRKLEGNAELVTMANSPMSRVKMLTDFSVSLGDVDNPDQCEAVEEFNLPVSGARYMFACRGDSMMPDICDGDMVVVGRPMSMFDRFRDDEMYLVMAGDMAMVKCVADPGVEYDYLKVTTRNKEYKLSSSVSRLPKCEVRSVYRVLYVLKKVSRG